MPRALVGLSMGLCLGVGLWDVKSMGEARRVSSRCRTYGLHTSRFRKDDLEMRYVRMLYEDFGSVY